MQFLLSPVQVHLYYEGFCISVNSDWLLHISYFHILLHHWLINYWRVHVYKDSSEIFGTLYTIVFGFQEVSNVVAVHVACAQNVTHRFLRPDHVAVGCLCIFYSCAFYSSKVLVSIMLSLSTWTELPPISSIWQRVPTLSRPEQNVAHHCGIVQNVRINFSTLVRSTGYRHNV